MAAFHRSISSNSFTKGLWVAGEFGGSKPYTAFTTCNTKLLISVRTSFHTDLHKFIIRNVIFTPTVQSRFHFFNLRNPKYLPRIRRRNLGLRRRRREYIETDPASRNIHFL
ncbi:hypothetical protein HanXRQr2_Chr07g0309361 [Helianthus annuus]|uniref:Uncharacterized protein n=1 Tax=Helianthus annuus TaxID=4232 RepID=A0A9K3INJ8_HELAN|nr:hypothetical protein HanXRQr2_Chr07g0309361 [Helianthus annuus]